MINISIEINIEANRKLEPKEFGILHVAIMDVLVNTTPEDMTFDYATIDLESQNSD